MFSSSKTGTRRLRRNRYLNTEAVLTIVVICVYFIYKTVTARLPKELRDPLLQEPGMSMGIQPSLRGSALQVPAKRDMLSVQDLAPSEEERVLAFLNLGRWNVSEPGESSHSVDDVPKSEHVKDTNHAVDSSLPGNQAVKRENHKRLVSNTTINYGAEGKGIEYIDEVDAIEPVISPHNFKYIINPEDFCDSQDLYFITYVHTAAKYVERRNHIRRTWGNSDLHGRKFKVLFVLGANGDPEMQKAVVEESDKYGDILQEDFIDTYRNLTYKGIAALKWIEKYCNHAKYVLKTDDDTFVNTFTYIRYLQSIDRIGTDTENMILCAVWHQMTVSRKGKWSVTRQQFNASSYPTYCSGCAFTFTMDVALAIHKISYHVPFFWVDDAYITGILPMRIGKIKHRNCRSTYEMNSDKLEAKFAGNEWWRYIFSSDIHRFDEAEDVWNKVVKLYKAKT